ncbi:MAG: Abi family protein, partial [Ureaplasma sp.]|nr:Abi family protein [Ureaplasma sp.]
YYINSEMPIKNNRDENLINKLVNSNIFRKIDEQLLDIINKYFYIKEINELVSNCSFGTLIKIFKSLNRRIQYKIIKSYNGVIWGIDEFLEIMKIIHHLRNKITHCSNVYNLKINSSYNTIYKFIINNNIKIELKSKKVNIFIIIKIISKILENKMHKEIDFVFINKTNKKIIF